jgi:gas vesicle protein
MKRNAWIWGMIAGAGAGAATMYFLDPDRGARRRALVRDQFIKLNRQLSEAMSGMSHDIANRGHGVLMETRRLINGTLGQGTDRPDGENEQYAAGRIRKLNRRSGPGDNTPETIH